MNLFRPLALLLALLGACGAGEIASTATTAAEPLALHFSLNNPRGTEELFSVAAGTVWTDADGGRFVVLRAGEVKVAAHAAASISVPAAALSAQTVWKGGKAVTLSPAKEPRLSPLVDYLATRNDVPRETSQLVALAITENITFAGWQKYLEALRPPAAGTPSSDTAGALDALTILRTIAPKSEFALASDGALKLRALHDPMLRGKALQLYGLVVPGDAPVGGVAPDLGQLLHTKPGDNCPICRMRGQMQKAGDVP